MIKLEAAGEFTQLAAHRTAWVAGPHPEPPVLEFPSCDTVISYSCLGMHTIGLNHSDTRFDSYKFYFWHTPCLMLVFKKIARTR